MYPVLSLLRRLPSSVVYVKPSLLTSEGGELVVPTHGDATPANLINGVWVPDQKGIPMYSLVAKGKTGEERAVALTKRENELCEVLDLESSFFTLFVGEEIEEDDTRYARLGMSRGYFRWKGKALEKLEGEPDTRVFSFHKKKLPPGVIREIR